MLFPISHNWDPQLAVNNNHCDGLVLYALTGLLPEQMSLKDFSDTQFQYIRDKLSDPAYESKDTFMSLFWYFPN